MRSLIWSSSNKSGAVCTTLVVSLFNASGLAQSRAQCIPNLPDGIPGCSGSMPLLTLQIWTPFPDEPLSLSIDKFCKRGRISIPRITSSQQGCEKHMNSSIILPPEKERKKSLSFYHIKKAFGWWWWSCILPRSLSIENRISRKILPTYTE